jgi:hypothetical protein
MNGALLGSALAFLTIRKHWTRLERLDGDKHFRLLSSIVNWKEKSFDKLVPCRY